MTFICGHQIHHLWHHTATGWSSTSANGTKSSRALDLRTESAGQLVGMNRCEPLAAGFPPLSGDWGRKELGPPLWRHPEYLGPACVYRREEIWGFRQHNIIEIGANLFVADPLGSAAHGIWHLRTGTQGLLKSLFAFGLLFAASIRFY